MANGIILSPVRCQPPCSGTFAFLGSHTGFANRKCHRCRKCSDPFESSTAKLVAAIVQTCSNAQKSEAAAQAVGSDQFCQGDPDLCWGSFAFSDLWFDISLPVAYCSSSTPAIVQWYLCLSLEPHWSMPIRRVQGVKVVVARCQNVSSKLFWLLGPIVAQIATPKAGAQHLQSCCRCISSGAMNCLGQRKLFSTHDAA